MEKEKKFLGRLIEKIGNFIKKLFDVSEQLWDELAPEIQSAIIGGSKVLDIINANITHSPGEIIRLIQTAIPDLTHEKLLEGLNIVADGLNIAERIIKKDNLEEVILEIVKYLETLQNKTWAGIMSLAAKLFAAFLAPNNKWDLFESLMVYAYQTFVKKK